MTRHVYVDGADKGEVFKKHNRWHWRRGEIAVEPFARGSTLEDVADWARKCCNGKTAVVREHELTLKERSKLRRLLREFGKAQAKGWDDDVAILEAEMKPLLERQGLTS